MTESDLQQIKNFIQALEQKLISEITQLKEEVKNISTKVEIIQAKVDANNVKIDTLDKRTSDCFNNLDKRISNQEFIYRAVILAIILTLLTPLITNAVLYFWKNPLFPIP